MVRHRYASVKMREVFRSPISPPQLGHSRKSMTLDVYSHLLLKDG
jgi:hypothetical protein